MGCRWRWLLILLGCGVVAVLVLAFRWHREPYYHGRSLSRWLMVVNPTDGKLSAESQMAIRHIGSNGVPFLLKWMQLKPVQYQQPGPMRMRLVKLCLKLPRSLAEPLIRRIIGHGIQPQYQSFEALCILGPEARSAIPELSRLIETSYSTMALGVLAHIGDEAVPPMLAVVTNRTSPYRAEVISVLAGSEMKYTFNQTVASTLMFCLDDSDFNVAFDAADVLCDHHIEPEVVLVPLIHALERDDQIERRRVLDYLHGFFARNFTMASVLQFLRDTNSSYSTYAAGALGQLAKGKTDLLEAILPALTNSLRDPRLPVRRAVASALDLLENAAEPAVPALLDAWNDPDYKMRLLATNAICDMPAYAILRDINSLSGEEALSESEKISFFRGIHGYIPGPKIAPLLNHYDPRIREMATNAFQKLRESSSEK